MRRIKLTRGKYSLVDDSDFEFMNVHKWHCSKDGYAVRHVQKNKRIKRIHLHRIILNTPDGYFTDHINGDRLDNRKSNLRVCTNRQNQQNRGKPSNNTSGYKGVVWNKKSRKWQATIMVNSKQIHLGLFVDKEDAYDVRCKATKNYFSEFAHD